ncbi:MAG: hypothetical protein P8R37_12125 [Opitutae bacterium]|nr:hypothetical protein [Opitutae bacterium]
MSSSKFHVTLTNYARGLSQDLRSTLADFIAPEVIVPAATGQYKDFSDKNCFQVLNTSRAVGGPARRLEFAASDPTYNCLPQALEIPIDDHERDEAGRGDPLHLEQAKTRTLVSSSVASHERKVFNAVAGSITATAGIGAWTGATNSNDPIAEIDAQIEALATDTGMMPNRIVIGLPAWAAIRHNPQVIARFPGAASVGVTRNQFSSLLLNPDLDIRVGVLSYDENLFGKAKSAKNIVGSEMYLFHGNNTPSLYDPCFMKTFRTRRGGVDEVRTYREESSRSDVLAVDWTEDIKLTSAISAKRITVT